MSENKIFPKEFFWGGATSGPQSEGSFDKKQSHIFDYWHKIEPEIFYDGVGPDIASDFYHRYKEDISLFKEIGFNSFRTSIQWTRLIKDFETAEIDEDGANYYSNIIDELIAKGITPIINLHHFDLPIELLNKYGGWTSRYVVDLFVKFAVKAFELFGDRVKYWTTFNEPIVVVEGQYLYQFHYPNEIDGKKAVQTLYNLNLASAKVVKAYKNMYKDAGQIGIILNLTPAYPRDINNSADALAAKYADQFFNKSFLDIALKGSFDTFFVDWMEADGVIWEADKMDKEVFEEGIVDFLGVNYYQPRRIKARECQIDTKAAWMPENKFEDYDMPGKRMNPYRGWEIYPKAIYDIAKNLQMNYENPSWFISENGMGIENESRFIDENGDINDQERIEFYTEHLSYLHQAISEGANCFGYHVWTPIDCWSWCNAYKNRYGFISIDLETQKRTIKKSGTWFEKLANTNTLIVE